ncbi:MAG: hypothetical protein K6T26_07680, partial [Alicyclobacillus sp.]|nr:hypothetical protein [Alicyclobacillus sp.]
VMGYLTDRMRRRAPLGALAYFLAAVGLYAGGMINSIPWAMTVLIAGVCCQQAGAGNIQALLHSFSGKRFMGRAAGVMNGVGNFVSFLTPALVGAMIGSSGNFATVMLFLSLVLLVASLAQFALMKWKY